jgi:RNA polymerase sigma-70 factor (ECF subfamily)
MTGPGQQHAAADATGRLEPDAFAAQFQASAPVFWTLAAGVLGHRNAVDDVLQEAAMIGLRKLAQFRTGTNFTAWMARIVRFTAQNHRRGERRRRAVATDPEILDGSVAAAPHPEPAPHDRSGALLADRGAFGDGMFAALAALKPIARSCLLLKVVAELEYADIARVLAIPEGTAMSHVHRARAAMLHHLTERAERR